MSAQVTSSSPLLFEPLVRDDLLGEHPLLLLERRVHGLEFFFELLAAFELAPLDHVLDFALLEMLAHALFECPEVLGGDGPFGVQIDQFGFDPRLQSLLEQLLDLAFQFVGWRVVLVLGPDFLDAHADLTVQDHFASDASDNHSPLERPRLRRHRLECLGAGRRDDVDRRRGVRLRCPRLDRLGRRIAWVPGRRGESPRRWRRVREAGRRGPRIGSRRLAQDQRLLVTRRRCQGGRRRPLGRRQRHGIDVAISDGRRADRPLRLRSRRRWPRRFVGRRKTSHGRRRRRVARAGRRPAGTEGGLRDRRQAARQRARQTGEILGQAGFEIDRHSQGETHGEQNRVETLHEWRSRR